MRFHRKAMIEKVASDDPLRPYIREPYLDLQDNHQPTLVSCNGRALVAIPVESPEGEREGQVPAAALKAARKKAGRDEKAVVVCMKDDVAVGMAGFQRPSPGVKYPDWRQIIKDNEWEAERVVLLDAKLLLAAVQAMGGEGPVRIELSKRKGDPMRVTAMERLLQNAVGKPCIEGAKGILMPMFPDTQERKT